VHEVYQCYKIMNGQELLGSRLMAKLDVKGLETLSDWKDSKVEEFCQRNEGHSVEQLTSESIESADGGASLSLFEKSLFENYAGVLRLFGETVEKKELIEQVAHEQQVL